jgi:LPS-assembly protein
VVRLTSCETNLKHVNPRRLGCVSVRDLSSVGDRLLQRALRTIYLLITITGLGTSHPQLAAQEVTSEAPRVESLPDGPGAVKYPEAKVVPQEDNTTLVEITTAGPQSKTGSLYVLDDEVVIHYREWVVRADHIEYDIETGDLTAKGHLKVTGGPNSEIISASHGEMNLRKQTGRFYDVIGSVGLKNSGKGKQMVYSSGNPFLFTGRMVVQTGPRAYEVYDGTVTSCQLPDPDWILSAAKFTVANDKASAKNSVFKLVNIPLMWLPYVTHAVASESRQSGFLIPAPGYSSTKGFTFGEEIYWAINRSTDLTVGATYFSLRGWEQSALFRYHGLGNNFARVHYKGLLDRGYYSNGTYVNQGGEDATASARYDFSAHTRVVGDAEYLSSFAYRQAFTENFNQAVSSDILSYAYGVYQDNGYSAMARMDRYQGLKQTATATMAEEQIRIFRSPSVELATTEHRIGEGPVLWSMESSFAGLKRVQPSFATTGLTQRLDLHPELVLPLSADGWHFRTSVGARETIYTRSRQTPYTSPLPVESSSAVNRAAFELETDLRAPVVERTFQSKLLDKLFGSEVKHTIEPEFKYRYVTGVDNFLNILRFDDADVVSNTNEMEYGVTQRLFIHPRKSTVPCVTTVGDTNGAVDPDTDGNTDQDSDKERNNCGRREWMSWRLTQKYFFDPTFGGAVIAGRRNIFETTLNLSGIAFLTESREISPLISRLRIQPSQKVDAEWDFDLDTGAKKFTSNNVLVNVHEGNYFSGLSYARLNAPGRFYTDGMPSSVSNFSQLRLLAGYGSPTKKGLGVAGNVGLDLKMSSIQYATLQTSYNWDCCGFSVEYRKYELGSVRNENAYRFNFTLANIGTAGNLRRAERLF